MHYQLKQDPFSPLEHCLKEVLSNTHRIFSRHSGSVGWKNPEGMKFAKGFFGNAAPN